MAEVVRKSMSVSAPVPVQLPKGLAGEEPEAAKRLKEAVEAGQEWHVALLEAIGRWTLPEEEHQGQRKRYLMEGEAFDWLLLAERLSSGLDGIVPVEQKEALLFHGRLPAHINGRTFQELLGINKYRAHLNFWYGVVVEEALQLAVEEEVRKQHRAKGLPDSEDLEEEAFVRIYNDTRTNLLTQFLVERYGPRRKSLSLTDMKEFTYRIFKRRLKIWDPARVASDTRKGLERLHKLRPTDALPGP